MKAAMIYYSLEGNMEYIAKRICQKTGADIIKLTPSKEYPTGKISKFIWGGKSVTFGEKPSLLNEKIKLEEYDTLIIGSPIWAGTFTPPINTFLYEYEISDKNIILVATHAGGGGEKSFQKMRGLLANNEILGTFEFKNPTHTKDESVEEKLDQILQLLQKASQ